jgi:hypothetical protein
MKITAQKTSRRGGFVTVLVLLALVVASIAFVALSSRTSQVHRQASDHGTRALAVLLAESALEEAHVRAGRLANDPDAPAESGVKLFDRFRVWGDQGSMDALSTGGFTFQLDVPRTRELAAAAPFAVHAFTVGVESEVPAQLPLLRANDRAGVVVYRVTVTSGRIREVVERTYGFRVSLSSPMRPFERVTLMVGDAQEFFKSPAPGEPALSQLAGGLAARWEEFAQDRKAAITELRQALTTRPPTSTATVPDEATLTALEKAQDDLGPEITRHLERVESLERQGYLVAVHTMQRAGSGEAKVDLGQLDWPRAIGEAREQAVHEAATFHHDLDEIRAAASSEFRKGEDVSAICTRALASAKRFEQRFGALFDKTRAITKDFVVFGPQHAKLKEQFEQSFELLSPQAWAARTYLKVDAADARTSNGTLADFLSRRGHPARPFNGILLWNNPGKPLALNGLSYSGKMVVVATGDVEVSGLKKADQDSLLTVVALGKLTVKGQVEASLVASAELDMQAGAQVQGNLLATKLSKGLAGTVAMDPRLTAGWGPDQPSQESAAARRHYHVAFSPGPLSTSVKS